MGLGPKRLRVYSSLEYGNEIGQPRLGRPKFICPWLHVAQWGRGCLDPWVMQYSGSSSKVRPIPEEGQAQFASNAHKTSCDIWLNSKRV